MQHGKFKDHIGLFVLQKKNFKGFYHMWEWQPSGLCDLDHLHKFFVPPFHEGSA